MKILKRLFILTVLLSTLLTFNIYAMENNNYVRDTPQDKEKHNEDTSYSRWIWINDEVCVKFNFPDYFKKEAIEKRYSHGMLSVWAESGNDGYGVAKTRDTYSGKWSQSDEGIWSFTFDDYTIPVGVTKINNALYAFNTFGELKEGYEYYTGFKTEADGLVKADSAEFTQWLGTQYLPDCTSRK